MVLQDKLFVFLHFLFFFAAVISAKPVNGKKKCDKVSYNYYDPVTNNCHSCLTDCCPPRPRNVYCEESCDLDSLCSLTSTPSTPSPISDKIKVLLLVVLPVVSIFVILVLLTKYRRKIKDLCQRHNKPVDETGGTGTLEQIPLELNVESFLLGNNEQQIETHELLENTPVNFPNKHKTQHFSSLVHYGNTEHTNNFTHQASSLPQTINIGGFNYTRDSTGPTSSQNINTQEAINGVSGELNHSIVCHEDMMKRRDEAREERDPNETDIMKPWGEFAPAPLGTPTCSQNINTQEAVNGGSGELNHFIVCHEDDTKKG